MTLCLDLNGRSRRAEGGSVHFRQPRGQPPASADPGFSCTTSVGFCQEQYEARTVVGVAEIPWKAVDEVTDDGRRQQGVSPFDFVSAGSLRRPVVAANFVPSSRHTTISMPRRGPYPADLVRPRGRASRREGPCAPRVLSSSLPVDRRLARTNSRISARDRPVSIPGTFSGELERGAGRTKNPCPSRRRISTAPSALARLSSSAKPCLACE